MSLIEGCGLEYLITQDPPSRMLTDESGKIAVNQEFETWHRFDSQVKAVITSSLFESTLPYIVGKTTSKEIKDLIIFMLVMVKVCQSLPLALQFFRLMIIISSQKYLTCAPNHKKSSFKLTSNKNVFVEFHLLSILPRTRKLRDCIYKIQLGMTFIILKVSNHDQWPTLEFKTHQTLGIID